MTNKPTRFRDDPSSSQTLCDDLYHTATSTRGVYNVEQGLIRLRAALANGGHGNNDEGGDGPSGDGPGSNSSLSSSTPSPGSGTIVMLGRIVSLRTLGITAGALTITAVATTIIIVAGEREATRSVPVHKTLPKTTIETAIEPTLQPRANIEHSERITTPTPSRPLAPDPEAVSNPEHVPQRQRNRRRRKAKPPGQPEQDIALTDKASKAASLSSAPTESLPHAVSTPLNPFDRGHDADTAGAEKPVARDGETQTPPTIDPDERLRREIASLAKTRESLQADPAKALELARHGEKEFAGGIFSEERQAIIVFALARMGHKTKAHSQAEKFLKRHPASPFSERVRKIADETANGDGE